jgi:hypothetical protein
MKGLFFLTSALSFAGAEILPEHAETQAIISNIYESILNESADVSSTVADELSNIRCVESDSECKMEIQSFVQSSSKDAEKYLALLDGHKTHEARNYAIADALADQISKYSGESIDKATVLSEGHASRALQDVDLVLKPLYNGLLVLVIVVMKSPLLIGIAIATIMIDLIDAITTVATTTRRETAMMNSLVALKAQMESMKSTLESASSRRKLRGESDSELEEKVRSAAAFGMIGFFQNDDGRELESSINFSAQAFNKLF